MSYRLWAMMFIGLLKETSVAGYIAIQDLTKGADIIRSRTYSAFMPLIAGSADLSGTGYGIYVLCTETGDEVKKQ